MSIQIKLNIVPQLITMIYQPRLQTEFTITWTQYCESEDGVAELLKIQPGVVTPQPGVPDKYPGHSLVLDVIIQCQTRQGRDEACDRLNPLLHQCTIDEVEDLSRVHDKVFRDIRTKNISTVVQLRVALNVVQRIVCKQITRLNQELGNAYGKRKHDLLEAREKSRAEAEAYNKRMAEEASQLLPECDENGEEIGGDTEPDSSQEEQEDRAARAEEERADQALAEEDRLTREGWKLDEHGHWFKPCLVVMGQKPKRERAQPEYRPKAGRAEEPMKFVAAGAFTSQQDNR